MHWGWKVLFAIYAFVLAIALYYFFTRNNEQAEYKLSDDELAAIEQMFASNKQNTVAQVSAVVNPAADVLVAEEPAKTL